MDAVNDQIPDLTELQIQLHNMTFQGDHEEELQTLRSIKKLENLERFSIVLNQTRQHAEHVRTYSRYLALCPNVAELSWQKHFNDHLWIGKKKEYPLMLRIF